jgi:hypothetical protein
MEEIRWAMNRLGALEPMTDQAQWFDGLGNCRCGKPATGVLRGTRNESYGPYCRRCAEKRIKAAEKARREAVLHPAVIAPSKGIGP